MTIQWIASAVGELNITVLTDIAINMIVLILRDHSDSLITAFDGDNSGAANTTLRSIQLVIVSNTEYSIVNVDSERHSVETFVALLTPETTRMIALAHGV